jgi:hypothetical protein
MVHNWFTAYNPATKEACQFYVVGSSIDGFLQEDAELIRAFFYKNAGYELVVSAQDALLDRIYDEGGILLNGANAKMSTEETKEFRLNYIEKAYK